MGINYHTSDSDEPTGSRRPFRADRKFLPFELYGEEYDLDHIDEETDGWTLVPCHREDPCPHCGRRERHFGCLIIAVDGACRGNGTHSARSAIGVYFAERSRWNNSVELDDPAPTNQKAELEACLLALRLALRIRETTMEGLEQIVIKADSEYVVKGMTEWIFKWRTNGYRNAKGTTVMNAILFKQIEDKVTKLNDLGVEALFWHVSRSRNGEADALANAGFR